MLTATEYQTLKDDYGVRDTFTFPASPTVRVETLATAENFTTVYLVHSSGASQLVGLRVPTERLYPAYASTIMHGERHPDLGADATLRRFCLALHACA